MIGFFVKKSFFDTWDNLFSLLGLNLVFVLLFAFGVILPVTLGAGAWIVFLLLLVVVLAAYWWTVCAYALNRVADFNGMSFADLATALRASIIPGLQLGLMLLAILVLVYVGLPFYLALGGLPGAFLSGLLFWIGLTFGLAIQYYIPLRVRLGGGFVKNLKKCFIIFVDNPGYSIFLFFYNFATLVLSCLFFLFIPGLAGIALGLDDALRLRLYKYDWLEANPGAKGSAAPWNELLAGDGELLGKRSFRGMIFPWKE